MEETPVSFAKIVPQVDATTTDLARICAALTNADGQVLPAEVDVSARLIAELTGALDTPALRSLLSSTATPTEYAESVARLATSLDDRQRKALLWGLLDVAAADAFTHPEEVKVVARTAEGLGFPPHYVDVLMDVHAAARPIR